MPKSCKSSNWGIAKGKCWLMTRTLYAKKCSHCGIRYPWEPGKITHQCGGKHHATRIHDTDKTEPSRPGQVETAGTTAAGNSGQNYARQYKMKRRPPTPKQAEYLKLLCEQLGYDYEQYDLSKLRQEEVSRIITELKEELG